jgi:hypothetical protein
MPDWVKSVPYHRHLYDDIGDDDDEEEEEMKIHVVIFQLKS